MAKLISFRCVGSFERCMSFQIILASDYDASFEAIKQQLTKSIPNGSAFSGHALHPLNGNTTTLLWVVGGTNNIRSSSITSGRVTVALGLLLVLYIYTYRDVHRYTNTYE